MQKKDKLTANQICFRPFCVTSFPCKDPFKMLKIQLTRSIVLDISTQISSRRLNRFFTFFFFSGKLKFFMKNDFRTIPTSIMENKSDAHFTRVCAQKKIGFPFSFGDCV